MLLRAIEAVKALQKAGKHLIFFTANSRLSRKQYTDEFKARGFDGIEERQIFCPANIAAMWLKEIHPDVTRAYCVGAPGLIDELEAAGVSVLTHADGGTLDSAVGAVVIGQDDTVTDEKLKTAQSYLDLKSVLFVDAAPHAIKGYARFKYETKPVGLHGLRLNDCEIFISGKPNPYVFTFMNTDNPELNFENAYVVGDSI